MIVAGIDEAGYGPLLGPLVVGCCAVELHDIPAASPDGELPCIWKRLNRLVSRNRGKTGRKLHVNDSKEVYSPSIGLKELERSVLSLGGAFLGAVPADLAAFLKGVAPTAFEALQEHPWYAPADAEAFPIEQEAVPLNIFCRALRDELSRTGTSLAMFTAQVMGERQFNRRIAATRNKSTVSFNLVALHLDALLNRFASRGLVIFCDRQGGRERYGPLLRLMFEEWDLAIEREEDGFADYRLTRAGQCVRLVFCEKGERKCMAVAVASMISKYLREALMRRFNHWWRLHLPELAPTAGYYNDGLRFLNDIAPMRRALNIADAHLIRER